MERREKFAANGLANNSNGLGKIHSMTINTGRQNRKRLLNRLGFSASKARNASPTGSPVTFHRSKLDLFSDYNEQGGVPHFADPSSNNFDLMRPRQHSFNDVSKRRQHEDFGLRNTESPLL